MYCNQIFSMISPNEDGVNTIKNIIVADNYEVASQLARSLYGDSAYAVDTTLCPVVIGDKHIDGNFYRDDKLIPYNPTEAEEIKALREEIEMMVDMDADLLYEVALLKLGLTEDDLISEE